MSFMIYVIGENDTEGVVEHLAEEDAVESGLSSGELRQALLDRFRQELTTDDIYFVNLSLQPFDLEFEEDLIESEQGRESMLTDIENLLYDAEDETLLNTFWEFHNERIYVKGEA